MSALWTLLGVKPFVIDLSHHNADPIDFDALYADGVRLVIHKATQGSNYVDSKYQRRRKAAVDAGLKWEAYHFADNSPVQAQLKHFLAVASLDTNMRGAVDFEPNGSASISFLSADAFSDAADLKLGRQVLRYTGAGFLSPAGKGLTPRLRNGPLWWSKYGPMMTRANLDPLGIDPARIVMWQETDRGNRDGIAGLVDESYWLGTAAEIDAYPALPATYPTGVSA